MQVGHLEKSLNHLHFKILKKEKKKDWKSFGKIFYQNHIANTLFCLKNL